MITSTRLVIHADEYTGAEVTRAYWPSLKNLVRTLRTAVTRRKAMPLFLQIKNVRTNHVLAVEDASPLVNLALPAGTYRVSAYVGNITRDYAFTLDPEASLDLHLRLAPGLVRMAHGPVKKSLRAIEGPPVTAAGRQRIPESIKANES